MPANHRHANAYQKLSMKSMQVAGITPEFLIANYPQELKRFKLSCDFGETGITLQPSLGGKHLLHPAAEAWIRQACSWPPRDEVAGIPVNGIEGPIALFLGNCMKDDHRIPDKFLSNQVQLTLATHFPMRIEQIPADIVTNESIAAAVLHNPLALMHAPPHMHTQELCFAALKSRDIPMLKHVSPSALTDELLIFAVQCNAQNIDHIPNGRLTRDIALHIANTYEGGLSKLSPDIIDESLLIDIMTLNGSLLRYIDPAIQTPAIRTAAIISSAKAVGQLPADLTPAELEELMTLAVKTHEDALQYIPRVQISLSLSIAAVRSHTSAVRHVPMKLHHELAAALELIEQEQGGSLLTTLEDMGLAKAGKAMTKQNIESELGL